MLRLQWAVAAAILSFCGVVLTSCSNSDNAAPDITPLTEWQAGRTVSPGVVAAYGGIDKCFAAEPIPDDVWQRMQGRTYKENPDIGRDDLRHIRALHWDFPYKIDHDDLCFKLFTEAGFDWGGDWTSRKDYQHFELIE